MQNDFEAWLKVMMTQQTTEPAISTPGSSAGKESVDENLQAFYKARDQIYSNIRK
jgi:hypothetical protein